MKFTTEEFNKLKETMFSVMNTTEDNALNIFKNVLDGKTVKLNDNEYTIEQHSIESIITERVRDINKSNSLEKKINHDKIDDVIDYVLENIGNENEDYASSRYWLHAYDGLQNEEVKVPLNHRIITSNFNYTTSKDQRIIADIVCTDNDNFRLHLVSLINDYIDESKLTLEKLEKEYIEG